MLWWRYTYRKTRSKGFYRITHTCLSKHFYTDNIQLVTRPHLLLISILFIFKLCDIYLMVWETDLCHIQLFIDERVIKCIFKARTSAFISSRQRRRRNVWLIFSVVLSSSHIIIIIISLWSCDLAQNSLSQLWPCGLPSWPCSISSPTKWVSPSRVGQGEPLLVTDRPCCWSWWPLMVLAKTWLTLFSSQRKESLPSFSKGLCCRDLVGSKAFVVSCCYCQPIDTATDSICFKSGHVFWFSPSLPPFPPSFSALPISSRVGRPFYSTGCFMAKRERRNDETDLTNRPNLTVLWWIYV